MAVFKLTQIIDRPVDEVFNTVIHLEDFPKWSPQNPTATRLSDGEIGEGSRFEMEIKGFGLVPQTLEEFDRNRRLRVVPHIRQIAWGHRFIFSDLGGRTRLDHEMEMTPKGALRPDAAHDVPGRQAKSQTHSRRAQEVSRGPGLSLFGPHPRRADRRVMIVAVPGIASRPRIPIASIACSGACSSWYWRARVAREDTLAQDIVMAAESSPPAAWIWPRTTTINHQTAYFRSRLNDWRQSVPGSQPAVVPAC